MDGRTTGLHRTGVQRRRDADVLLKLSRRLVYLGMLLLPLLSLRLAKGLDVSDGLFALAALVLIVSRHRPVVPAPPLWYFGSFLIVIGGITSSYLAMSASSSASVPEETPMPADDEQYRATSASKPSTCSPNMKRWLAHTCSITGMTSERICAN